MTKEYAYLTKINALQLLMIEEAKRSGEKTRLIRDKMISRLRIAAKIESLELSVIEKELLKIIKKSSQ